MARFIMILVIGAIITYGYTNITLNQYTSQGTKNAVDNFSYNRSHDIANGMLEIVLMRLANDNDYLVTNQVSETLFDGQVTYSAIRDFFEGDSLIKVMVSAQYNGVTKNIITYTERRAEGGWVPPFVRAAWSANGDINNAISDMSIDGRNHDLNNNLIPQSGKYGVSTSIDFRNDDNAEIGGTRDSIDYPMTFPENPNVIEDNYNWGGKWPETPDEFFGFPEGTLKAAAQTGENGSQYVFDPPVKLADVLTFPLSGITYIEVTDDQKRELKLEENGNNGILIFHGPGRIGKLGKIEVDGSSDGRFTGLLIADYSFHHHFDLLGSMVNLSPNLETLKTCGGNAHHWVNYSAEAVSNATGVAADMTGEVGNNTNTGGYGFAKKRMNVKHVYE